MQYFKNSNVITVPGWSMTAVSVSSDSALSNEGISKPGVYFLVDEGQCFYESQDMAARLAEIWRQNDPSQLDQQPQQETQPEERQSEEQWQEEVNQPVFEPTGEAEQAELTEATEPTEGEKESGAGKTAICFMSFNTSKKLQGEKILKLLGFLGHVKLHVDFGQAHAEGAERPDGFTVFAGSQIRPSRSEKFVSQYAEAYAKVDWDATNVGEHSTLNLLDGNMVEEYRNGESGGNAGMGGNVVTGGSRAHSGVGTLTEDVYFSSASDAAKFVSGYKNISGPEYWKDEVDHCLRELREHSMLIGYQATGEKERFPV